MRNKLSHFFFFALQANQIAVSHAQFSVDALMIY